MAGPVAASLRANTNRPADWSRARMVVIGSATYGIAVVTVGLLPLDMLWAAMPICGVSSAVMFIPTLLWLLERAPRPCRP